jgi:hypothetical protein
MPTHPYQINVLVLFFGMKCHTIVKGKKPLWSVQKVYLEKYAQRLPYFKKRNLEVVIFRQWILEGHKSKARFQNVYIFLSRP